MDEAEKRLPNFKNDWFPVVAFPAFETNLTIIYEKPSSEEEDISSSRN